MIGQRIKTARKNLSISQQELAAKLGLKTQSVQQWESGRTKPRFNRVKELAELLNVSTAWLYGGSEDNDAKNHESEMIDLGEMVDLSKLSSRSVLVKLIDMGWIQICRSDVSIDALADLFANELKQASMSKGFNCLKTK